MRSQEATGSRPLVGLKHLLEDFHWFHTTIGLVGNLCFFVGSVMFLWEATKTAAIWLFILGSLGMLLGSVGDAFVSWEPDEQ
jgi:hypothetical protein